MEDKIKSIIAEQLGVDKDKLNPQTKLIDDLGADSLDLVELTLTLEDKIFDCKFTIPDEDAEKLTTVGEVVEYIKSKVKE